MNEWGLLARGCPKLVLGLSTSTSAGGPRLFNRLAGLAKQDGRWSREGERRRFPSVAMAAGTSSSSSSGTVLTASMHQAESMGRERRARGFHFGNSGHGKQRWVAAAAAAMATASRSSWGACWQHGEGKVWLGKGRGECRGAHLRRNWVEMAWWGRSTTVFAALFVEQREELGEAESWRSGAAWLDSSASSMVARSGTRAYL